MAKMRGSIKSDLIVVVSNAEKVNFICEVCGFCARDEEDLRSIHREKACTECVLNFKNIMIDDWKRGIRPTREVARAKMNIFKQEV